MKARVWSVAAALALVAISPGCSKKKEKTPLPTFVAVTASTHSVVANGVNSVTLTVTDPNNGPVTVSTTRGTFSGGGQTATVPGASGTLTLVTCNAATDTTCAGTAIVTATSATGSASVSITFGTLAAVCPDNCDSDPGCATMTCNLVAGGTGTCSSTTPSTCVAPPACTPNPAGATTETSCADGIDNDCRNGADCADTSCDGRPCKTGSPTFLCKSGACTDTTSGLAITVTPARTRLPPDGSTTTSVVVAVTADGAPASGMSVTASTSLGTLAPSTATTGADGTATFTFTASSTKGVATITASLTSVATITAQATVTLPGLGSLQIPVEKPGAVQYAVMGARGSGWNELGWIQVQALDETGQLYPDGLAVRFEHQRLGGSTLGAPLTADTTTCVATATGGCVGYLATVSSGDKPDTTGLARAMLQSGTIAGTLAVTATATIAGVTRSATLPTAAVVGARASGTNFSIVCSPRNVPALAEATCGMSNVDAPFTCAAILKDRYNNLLGTATQVIFESEAAANPAVATTPAYDPSKDPTSQADLGTALQIFNTLGSGLPIDVPVQAGEPSFDLGAPDVCGIRVHNPRDGVVTIIAIADGEEAFFDANGNGVYDLGEPFIDQGEPFLDLNDNGVWDDGSTPGTIREWSLDVNGNGVYDPPNGRWDATTKIWTQTVVVYTGAPATLVSATGYLGTRWAAPPFAGACTATPDPAKFAVKVPPTTPSSQRYYVVASDGNLNQLDTGTSYDVKVAVGTIGAEYQGLSSYADDLGLFYRYWPCDQSGVCASRCQATGTNIPCVMTPSVTGFGCGIAAPVVISAGTAADPTDDRIDWVVTTPYSVFRSSKSVIVQRSVYGTSN